jgi:hypothetical protein
VNVETKCKVFTSCIFFSYYYTLPLLKIFTGISTGPYRKETS